MPADLFQALKKVRVVGKPLNISRYDADLVKKAKAKKRISSTSVRAKSKD
jgi:ATP-dependent RNA helicase DeaD